MSRATRARRIAAKAAFGGGGAVGVAGGAVGVLWAQAMLARRRVGQPDREPFPVDGIYQRRGSTSGMPPYRLVMLGDSAAAGLGADAPEHTLAVLLAQGLADVSGRPVQLVNRGVVGAQTSGVDAQVDLALTAFDGHGPDVAVIMVGANDVTHRVPARASLRALDQVVRRLIDAHADVIVACCPDLGTVQPVPNPLRTLGRRWSRTLAAGQVITTVEAGGRAVSLGTLLGPEFESRGDEYFSADRFHPSSAGYRRCAEVILPSLCAALGLGPDPDEHIDSRRGDQVAPIATVAARAAAEPGAEISRAQVGGADRGTQGRWAVLRHRIPLLRPADDDVKDPAMLAEPAVPAPEVVDPTAEPAIQE